MAELVKDIASAWRKASQENRNKLAKMLFKEIKVEDKRVVSVRPQMDFEPFFNLNFRCHTNGGANDPDGSGGGCLKRDAIIPVARGSHGVP